MASFVSAPTRDAPGVESIVSCRTATIYDWSASADPLGEALHFLRMSGTLYCRSEFTAPWGLDLPLPCTMWRGGG